MGLRGGGGTWASIPPSGPPAFPGFSAIPTRPFCPDHFGTPSPWLGEGWRCRRGAGHIL